MLDASKLHITHICFADDLLLCFRADATSIQLLMEAFDHFLRVFSLTENREKSSKYMAGVFTEFKQQMMQTLHFTEGSLRFKYKGILLSSRKLNVTQ